MAIPSRPRILLIDSYDSFTHNLAALCRRAVPECDIHIIKNDAISISELTVLLDHFSAVIVGPGPGSPYNPDDIGLIKHLWKLSDQHLLPVFGVCLGLQSLALEFGGRLKRLSVVKHGQVSRILHQGSEIFKGVGDVDAVRYHSLHVELRGDEEVEPLAWADDGEENGRVVMAVKHNVKPFWAVQYHPESVRTRGGGAEVLSNFWRLAKNWAMMKSRQLRPWSATVGTAVGPSWPISPPMSAPHSSVPVTKVSTRVLQLPGIAPTQICELLGVADESSDFVLLDSAAQPGRFSVIGCLTAASQKITYCVGGSHVCVSTQGDGSHLEQLHAADIWTWLAAFMRARRAEAGATEVPFWGGLVGFLTYELGVQSLAAALPSRRQKCAHGRHSDVSLVFVERSIVLDSLTGKVHVQSILPDDDAWLDDTSLLLKQSAKTQPEEARASPTKRRKKNSSAAAPTVVLPDRERYIARINQAKEHLFAGDSYELCLTAATHIRVPKTVSTGAKRSSSSWELYKLLRSRNPAPHSAYLRLHPSTLLSSSPERFLSYSRPPHSTCQLRPIKGTVRKAPGVTRAVAEKALVGSAKEVAENLMIVDLIRHDLHGVVGEVVEVKQFCKVEEYKTVWQLVSVIEGKLPGDVDSEHEMNLGWEVLQRSLPPGSMTGAPKKRSVEILHTLEDDDRSVYSGVFGYWCVGGGGDWSVTIRSCFKHDETQLLSRADEDEDAEDDSTRADTCTEEWTLGAGGAITALSDPEAEWEEMIVKVESVIRAFGDVEFS
ncbi:para-aminobenzoic acid synthetase [Laetiporus sulphureus 93-53]|uniref:aminodeoxychorismate synthase n=1 Tax=Laetiporus sulphureus 93-53 TaxID=1314785 RepID=A0A165DXS8_9APHY|nr:para-aminobenzoic acid synthetase [Laetiporus sulphureus 93-53]KZT05839.1 para-aminobenzoic acid synthetase [Laetiporus sulphureus 93-53]